MPDRLEYLENLAYKQDQTFFLEDLQRNLEEIYHPKNVADISNMDNSLSYEYLVALDNKGFLAEEVPLGKGIYLQTMDLAVEERDLHFLYVQVSTVKPFLVRNIWKYLQGGQDLLVLAEPLLDQHKKAFAALALFAKKYGLVYVAEAELNTKILTEDGQISFYKKYFDEFSDC